MRKDYLLRSLFIFFASIQISAQITDYIESVATNKIFIEDDYLYYTDFDSDNDFIIKRTDLTAVLPTIEILVDFDLGIGPGPTAAMAKNGDYIYSGGYYILGGGNGPLYRFDISGGASPELLFSGDGYVGLQDSDMAYKSDFLYRTEYLSNDVVRENVSLTPPLTSTVYLNFDGIALAKSLHVDGLTLYIGLSNGDIYTKNLFLASPKELLYSSPTGEKINEILLFEGLIYFCDINGVHRFNPLEASPTTETIATTDYFESNPVGLAAKSFDSGDKFLYISDFNTKIIKVDLNDPTLSIKDTAYKESSIYPNPVSDIITVKSLSNIKKLTVYDTLGKLVLELNTSNQTNTQKVDISCLNSSIYHLKIKTELGEETKKIVKR